MTVCRSVQVCLVELSHLTRALGQACEALKVGAARLVLFCFLLLCTRYVTFLFLVVKLSTFGTAVSLLYGSQLQ